MTFWNHYPPNRHYSHSFSRSAWCFTKEGNYLGGVYEWTISFSTDGAQEEIESQPEWGKKKTKFVVGKEDDFPERDKNREDYDTIDEGMEVFAWDEATGKLRQKDWTDSEDESPTDDRVSGFSRSCPELQFIKSANKKEKLLKILAPDREGYKAKDAVDQGKAAIMRCRTFKWLYVVVEEPKEPIGKGKRIAYIYKDEVVPKIEKFSAKIMKDFGWKEGAEHKEANQLLMKAWVDEVVGEFYDNGFTDEEHPAFRLEGAPKFDIALLVPRTKVACTWIHRWTAPKPDWSPGFITFYRYGWSFSNDSGQFHGFFTDRIIAFTVDSECTKVTKAPYWQDGDVPYTGEDSYPKMAWETEPW